MPAALGLHPAWPLRDSATAPPSFLP